MPQEGTAPREHNCLNLGREPSLQGSMEGEYEMAILSPEDKTTKIDTFLAKIGRFALDIDRSPPST